MAFDRLEPLGSRELLAHAERLERQAEEHRARREDWSDRLYAQVPKEKKAVRRSLIRIRRDLFNERPLRPGDLDRVADPDTRSALVSLEEERSELARSGADFLEQFSRSRREARSVLREIVRDPDFGAGLRLSSKSLYDRRNVLCSDPSRSLDGKTEGGLLRYTTRMAAKATPFGRFCAVVSGRLDTIEQPMLLSADPTVKTSRIRPNKRMMELLLQELVADDDARRQLPIRPNPTVRITEASIWFLASSGGREAFQSIERDAALDAVFGTAASSGRGTVLELARTVAAVPSIDAGLEEAVRYVDQLFMLGLLQTDLPGLGHDPEWPLSLQEHLRELDGEAVTRARSMLDDLRVNVDKIRATGVESHEDTDDPIEALRRLAQGPPSESGTPVVQLGSGPVVYEDATCPGELVLDRRHFAGAIQRTGELLQLLSPVLGERVHQARMHSFFETRFGSGRVPLLRFHEAYQREAAKTRDTQGENGERPGSSADGPSPGVTVATVAARLSALIAAQVRSDPAIRVVSISASQVKEAVGSVGEPDAEPLSFTLFGNWVPRPGHPEGGQLVAPRFRAHLGFGKYFSRFLYLLPEEILEHLRSTRPLDEGVVLAEIAGDQAFNANLRPPIQPCEIQYPTGDRIGCPEALRVGELEVGELGSGSELGLFVRGTDRRVRPLDLGFLNPTMRPPLYRLLRNFAPPSAIDLNLAPRVARQLSGEHVRRTPRIVYENSVVLARERWTLSSISMPLPVPREGEPSADFYRRMQSWRMKYGVPSRVYLSCHKPQSPPQARKTSQGKLESEGEENSKEEETARQRLERSIRDLRKPQYLDFSSPLLGSLLRRYRSIGPDIGVRIEECLPAREDLPEGPRGHRHVAECILQFDSGVRRSPVEDSEQVRKEMGPAHGI